MLVAECAVRADKSLEVEIRRVDSSMQHLALWIEDLWCTHPGKNCDEVFCLISPPTWTWYVGIPARFTLGRALWKLGQFASNGLDDADLMRTDVVSEREAVDVYGWEDERLRDALSCWDDEDDD